MLTRCAVPSTRSYADRTLTHFGQADRVLPDGLSNISVDRGRLTFNAPVLLQLSRPRRDLRIIFVHALIGAMVLAAVLAAAYKIGTQHHFKAVMMVLVSAYRIAVILSAFLLRILGHFLSPFATFLQLQATRVYASVASSYVFVLMQLEALLVAMQEEIVGFVH